MDDTLPILLRLPATNEGKCTVKLPHELKQYPDKDWNIALQAFYCNYNDSLTARNIVLCVEELEDITRTANNFHITNILAIIPTNHFSFEPLHLSFLKLHPHVLDKLTFKLLSDTGEPIILRERQCHIIIQLHNMPSRKGSFILRLRSNDVNDKLKFKLNHDIHLEKKGTWRVALQSIHYPTVSFPRKNILEMRFKYRDVKNQVIKIKPEYVKSPEDLLKKIVRGFTNLHIPTNNLKFIISAINNGVCIFASRDDEPINIWLNRDLAYMLGNSRNGYNNAEVDFTLLKNEKFSFPDKVDINRTRPTFANLLCNITKPIPVNSKFEPLLSILPLESQGQNFLYYEPQHLTYIDVDESTLKDVGLSFTDLHNNPLAFFPPNQEKTKRQDLYLNLHVKQFI